MPQTLTPSPSPTRLVNRVLAGATDIRQGEGRTVLASGMLFFLVLMAVMILRPLRDAVGLRSGIETLRVLILISVPLLLVAMPAFGYFISRVSRRILLTVSFRFCGAVLLGFYVVLAWLPEYAGQESVLVRSSGWIYVVFHSLFNLLLVSLFWALMADLFNIAESKRLFPAIAIGGTLGAVAGSACAGGIAHWLGPYALLLIAATLLEAAVWTARFVAWTRAGRSLQPTASEPIGGQWLAGITDLGHSSYLRGIALFILLTSMVYTMFHFTQLRIVAEAAATMQQRTVLFAHIDVWAQLATLLAQALLAGRAMRLLGVGMALAVLPLVAIAGFASLAAMPTLAACILFGATYRAVLNGFTSPSRETLFTVIAREQKFKAKSFLDTFMSRAGDASGALAEGSMFAMGPGIAGLAAAVLPLGLAWVALAAVLGRTQARLALGGTADIPVQSIRNPEREIRDESMMAAENRDDGELSSPLR